MVREPETSPPIERVGEQLGPIRRRLHEDFSELPGDVIDHCFAAEVIRFEGCRITAFLPILIDKNVRTRLRAIHVRGPEAAAEPPTGISLRAAR